MSVQRLNKTFYSEDTLKAAELNEITAKLDELITDSTSELERIEWEATIEYGSESTGVVIYTSTYGDNIDTLPETPVGGIFNYTTKTLDSVPTGWYLSIDAAKPSGISKYTTWMSDNNYIITSTNKDDQLEGYPKYSSTGWSKPIKYIDIKGILDDAEETSQTLANDALSTARSEISDLKDEEDAAIAEATRLAGVAQSTADEALAAIEAANESLETAQSDIDTAKAYLGQGYTTWVTKKDADGNTVVSPSNLTEQTTQMAANISANETATSKVSQTASNISARVSSLATFTDTTDANGNVTSTKPSTLQTAFVDLMSDKFGVYLASTSADTLKSSTLEVKSDSILQSVLQANADSTTLSQLVVDTNGVALKVSNLGTYNDDGTLKSFSDSSLEVLDGRIKSLVFDIEDGAVKSSTFTLTSNSITAKINSVGNFKEDGTLESFTDTALEIIDGEISSKVGTIDGDYIKATSVYQTADSIVLGAVSLTEDDITTGKITVTPGNISMAVTEGKASDGSEATNKATFQLKIANATSQAAICASEIVLSGTTIANAINAVSLNIDDQSHIYGTTDIATDGVLADFGYGTSGKTVFNADGSGQLGGGNIYWEKNGTFHVLASGNFEGYINATSGYFSGELKAATGTFKGELSAATGTFKGELSAATGTFKGDIAANSLKVTSISSLSDTSTNGRMWLCTWSDAKTISSCSAVSGLESGVSLDDADPVILMKRADNSFFVLSPLLCNNGGGSNVISTTTYYSFASGSKTSISSFLNSPTSVPILKVQATDGTISYHINSETGDAADGYYALVGSSDNLIVYNSKISSIQGNNYVKGSGKIISVYKFTSGSFDGFYGYIYVVPSGYSITDVTDYYGNVSSNSSYDIACQYTSNIENGRIYTENTTQEAPRCYGNAAETSDPVDGTFNAFESSDIVGDYSTSIGTALTTLESESESMRTTLYTDYNN